MADLADAKMEIGRNDSGKPKVRSRKSGVLALLIIVIVIAAGVFAYTRFFLSGFQSTDDATVSGNQVVVSSQILGRIASMAAREGDRVRSGETLARLDGANLTAQENQAKANEALAAQNVVLARVKLEEAQSDLSRAAVQFENKIISQEQYDHTKMAQTEAQVGLSIAQARERVAATQLASDRTSLGRTTITASATGIVAKKWAIVGDVVQPAQAIYTVYDLSKLWVDANFKETQIRYLAVGDSTQITVDAFPGRVFTGRVVNIGAATASQFALIPGGGASGNYTKVTQRVSVKISIDDGNNASANPAARLLPGMSAEVKVFTGKD